MDYQYKKGVCVHCGRSLICGKGVAHFKCSYRAQEQLTDTLHQLEQHRLDREGIVTILNTLLESMSESPVGVSR